MKSDHDDRLEARRVLDEPGERSPERLRAPEIVG
jgi:hypothetical protein